MTQERHDPWALLREARNSVALEVAAVAAFRVSDADKRVLDLLKRIDAALAAHDAAPPIPDAEQDGDGWRIDQRERYEGTTLCAVWRANGKWWWQAITQGAVTEKLGYANTLDEAKAAAIAAARGMR